MKISIVFVACFVISEGFAFVQDFRNITRTKRQDKQCSASEFLCGSGECIGEDSICDGKVDCKDGTDETNSCKNNSCPSFLFRCAYGACINNDYTCDGKPDCRDNSDEASSLCKKVNNSSACDRDQFQCKDGQCIEDGDQCDGIDNCADGSDETVELCSPVKCPKFTFKCAYGACINSEFRCNNRKDCKDNSDEEGCNGQPINPPRPTPTPTPKPVTPVTPPKVPTGNDCILPPYPENGKWSFVFISSNLRPGDIATTGTILNFTCDPKYGLSNDNSISVCNKNWNNIPKCIRTCPPFPKKNHVKVECKLNHSVISCDKPFEGTIAKVQCEDLYEDPYLITKPNNYCRDGSWDFAFPHCEPVCGLRIGPAEQLIINGSNAKKGEFPWHVGLYIESKYICGGSIITPKLILTAAHCFETNATELYMVAAGKYYSELNHPGDAHAQYSKINEIIIHQHYRGGYPHEAYDIAVLVLAKPFQMTRYVLPVCLDQSNYDLSNLANKVGIIVGWGYTEETGKPAETLKYLEVEYKNSDTCPLPHNMLSYYIPYAPDKLCAGLEKQGKSACKGDSGGGLVFLKESTKYYARGIVSVGALKKLGCNSDAFTLFTSVDFHISYIEELKSKYRM